MAPLPSPSAESMQCGGYLDVDVVLAVLDGVDIGIVDGLLMVLNTSRPITCRSQNLRQESSRIEDFGQVVSAVTKYIAGVPPCLLQFSLGFTSPANKQAV